MRMMMAVDYELQHGKRDGDWVSYITMCIQHENLLFKNPPIIIEKTFQGFREMLDLVEGNYHHYACDQVYAWHRLNVFPLREELHHRQIPFYFNHIPPAERDFLLAYARDKGTHPLEAFLYKVIGRSGVKVEFI